MPSISRPAATLGLLALLVPAHAAAPFAATTPVPDVHFAIIRLDYQSRAIEGAYEFTQPFRKTLVPPGYKEEGDIHWRLIPALDFGATEVQSRITGRQIFYAETIWMGRGRFLFPPADLFNPVVLHGFDNPAPDDVITHTFEYGANPAGVWDRVRDTDVVRRIASHGRYRVFLFDHFYTVGMSDPTTAEWIVVVFSRPEAPGDAGITELRWPRGVVTRGVDFTPEIALHNFGDAEASLQVALTVRAGGVVVYEALADAGTLAADETRAVLFDPIGDMGHDPLEVVFALRDGAGGPWSDAFADNDAASQVVTVVDLPVFRAAWVLPAGCLPMDFDGDGDTDMVGTTMRISLLQNDGYGRFANITARSSLGHMPLHPRHAVAGDFTGDGIVDLVVIHYMEAPFLLAGDGTGTFTDVSSGRGLETVAARWHIAVLDLEGDDDLDLVFNSHEQEWVMANDGSGYFTDATASSGIVSPGQTIHIAAGDLDGDADTDLVFTNWNVESQVWVNAGDGTFQALARAWGVPNGREAVIFDQNQDGKNDILFVRESRWGPPPLFRQTGALVFENVAAQVGPVPNAFDVDAADITADGYPDVILGSGDLLVSDAGAFAAASHLIADGQAMGNVRFVDIDGDTDVDIYSDTGVYLNQTLSREAPPDDGGDDPPPPADLPPPALEQNYPNPFNPETTIRYCIDQPGHVSLRVFDVAGRLVRTLVDESQTPRDDGFEVRWDGRNARGEPVASGVYFCRLQTGTMMQARKLVLLR